MIDYGIVNEEGKNKMKKLEVKLTVESDHNALEMVLETGRQAETEEG